MASYSAKNISRQSDNNFNMLVLRKYWVQTFKKLKPQIPGVNFINILSANFLYKLFAKAKT